MIWIALVIQKYATQCALKQLMSWLKVQLSYKPSLRAQFGNWHVNVSQYSTCECKYRQ